jgi:metal-dependent hydrolase (beta-lactamase superfamily II)
LGSRGQLPISSNEAASRSGIDKIAALAASLNPRIHLIAGGFHLVVAQDPEVEKTVGALRALKSGDSPRA